MSTLKKKAEKIQDQWDAQEALREIFDGSGTVYTILRHRSESGMSRRISCVIGQAQHECESNGHEGSVRDITWLVARALGEPVKGRAGYVQDVGITRKGCGMDMGFDLVYNLSWVLYAGEYTLKHRWL